MESEKAFEEKKQATLNAARAEGIVDVVTAGGMGDGISLKTVKLATELVKKHKKTAYRRLEARLEAQK